MGWSEVIPIKALLNLWGLKFGRVALGAFLVKIDFGLNESLTNIHLSRWNQYFKLLRTNLKSSIEKVLKK